MFENLYVNSFQSLFQKLYDDYRLDGVHIRSEVIDVAYKDDRDSVREEVFILMDEAMDE